jgi:hypothetical protein
MISMPKQVGSKTLCNQHKISNHNGVEVLNFATSKNLSKVGCFHIVTFINLLGYLLMGRHTTKLVIF